MKTRSLSILSLSVAIAAAPLVAPAQQTPSPLPPAASVPTPAPSPIIPVVPTVAPGYRASNERPASASVVGVTQQPFVGIALNDAIGMALSRNPDLAISASNTRIGGYQIQAAKGAYDVKFFVNPSINHSNNAPENAFFSGPNFGPIVGNNLAVAAGVSGQLASGTQYNINLTQTSIQNNTIINAFNPYYTASLNATVTQPLLRNFGPGNETRRQIELAFISEAGTTAQTLSTVSTTLAAVENAYWDLVAGWRNVAIQEDALHSAISQQHSNVRSARQGQSAPIDAVQSQTQVSTYQNNVFAALQNVSALQNQLKSLILDDPGDPIWRANLMPTTSFEQTPPEPSLEGILATAMQHRPELAQAAAQRQQAAINLAYAKNQRLPQVDLQLQYQGNGLAGTALPPLGGALGNATPPPYLDGKTGTAYGNIGRFPTYTAGVLISTPIGNNTAKADYAVAKEQQRIANITTANTDQRIAFDVRNALQDYESAQDRLYAARQAREAQQQVYASEIRKFRNGESTTFLVNQQQITLVQTEGTELQAQTDFDKAVVELSRSDGTILSANNVNVQTLGEGALKP
ncbi:MAG: TolC family protein [Candidatus Eremiobacteraeota bacterium]|nr:TolC family protein [Candidatus Eremiobacteraeota bacterium]